MMYRVERLRDGDAKGQDRRSDPALLIHPDIPSQKTLTLWSKEDVDLTLGLVKIDEIRFSVAVHISRERNIRAR